MTAGFREMAYLTNTVYVQSLDDIEAMDLHSRYTELLKVRDVNTM